MNKIGLDAKANLFFWEGDLVEPLSINIYFELLHYIELKVGQKVQVGGLLIEVLKEKLK